MRHSCDQRRMCNRFHFVLQHTGEGERDRDSRLGLMPPNDGQTGNSSESGLCTPARGYCGGGHPESFVSHNYSRPGPPAIQDLSGLVSAKPFGVGLLGIDVDDVYRDRLRKLVDWYGWAREMVSRLRLCSRRWRCSTAFSGIGCAELAGLAIERCTGVATFSFCNALERDPACRGVLAMHSPAAVCASNILDWLPEGTMSHDFSRMGFEELRNKIM